MQSIRRETCLSVTWSATDHTSIDPGMNSGLRSEGPATRPLED